MQYSDLKKSFDAARREQLSADKELNRIKKEIQSVAEKYSELEKVFLSAEADEKAKGLKEYKEKLIGPFEKELSETTERLKCVQAEYDEKRAGITYDNLLAQCSSKQDILREVREASAVLQEKLEVMVGKKFFHNLSECLEKQHVEFTEDNLDELIEYFNKNEKVIESYAEGETAVGEALNTVEHTLFSTDEGAENIRVAVSVGILVVTLFLRNWCLPGMSVLLTLFVVYNVLRNFKVYRILIVQKAVQDNIEQIDEHLKKQVEAEVEKQLQELEAKYTRELEKLRNREKELQDAILSAEVEADSTFEFDPNTLNLRKAAEIEKLDKQKSVLLVQAAEQEKLLAQKNKIVRELNDKLSSFLDNLKKQYLTGVGKDVIFNPRFLIDVDVVRNKAEYFNYPQTSCLFLYEELDDVYDFVRLMSVELRAKLNPFNLSIVTVDERNMGQDLVYFTSSDNDESMAGLYRVVTDANALKVFIGRTAKELMRRQTNIRREFDSIQSYNEKMVEINSLTEAYEFQFIIDPSDVYLASNDTARAIRIGGSLGLFVNVFMSKKNFVKAGDSIMPLFDAIGKVYYMDTGKLLGRAKDFVLDDMFSEEEV